MIATPRPIAHRPARFAAGGRVTRAEALRRLRGAFAEAGLDTPARDARALLLAALDAGPAALVAQPQLPVSEAQAALLEAYAGRRLAREPVARILGEWEFWGLPFLLSPETLVPRPETETLVETALRLRPDPAEPLRILDLGTGSGCLLVALLHERARACGAGVDRSAGALRTARGNALRNGVGGRALWAGSSWADAVCGRFDLLVSNPPYIASAVIPALDREVREHDPLLALDGGADGLAAYRAILAEAPRLLARGGLLLFEIGFDQGAAIPALLGELPLEVLEIAPDLSGNPRCVALKRT